MFVIKSLARNNLFTNKYNQVEFDASTTYQGVCNPPAAYNVIMLNFCCTAVRLDIYEEMIVNLLSS